MKTLTNILANTRPQTNSFMKMIERLFLVMILTPIVGWIVILAYMAIQL